VQLEPGKAFGPYVIVGSAGAGGMGEVYKARDTRLNRVVALKVIGSGLGERSELRRRFAAEGRAIAALSHPHICALYDTGHHEGRDFLVFEYLEGETLAHRLRRGPLPGHEVLGYAIHIAEALDYAHRQGIVHRDLKPANVLLTRTSGAKLLDFGLAQLRSTASRAEVLPDLATEPLGATAEGVIVGTPHYMAPERFDGREADARSDVFAFGAMLYEMITGRKAFDDKNQARVIAAILSSEPKPIGLVPGMPPELEWITQNCLVKDPESRWQSMGDVARVLEAIARTTSHGISPPAKRRRLGVWAGAALLVIAAFVAGAVAQRRSQSFSATGGGADEPISLSLLPPVGSAFALTESTVKSAQFALAPDGQAIVFVATTAGVRQLWVRELGRTDARLIAGTAGASYPFWSSDGRFVGFFAEGSLKKVSTQGRAPQILCKAANGRGGAWGKSGVVVFAPDPSASLYRISAAGGAAEQLTTLGPAHLAHRWPQLLDDGRVLFFVRSADANVQGIYVTSLSQPGSVQRIRAAATSGTYVSGQLLFVLNGELVAQALDARTLEPSGEAVPLGLHVSASSAMNLPVSASDRGVLATWDSVGGLSELVWFDRKGARLGIAGPVDRSIDRYVDFRLAPDEKRLALSRVDPATNTPDLAILDLERGALTALTSSPQTDATPVWSPDGKRLVFRSNRRGLHDLFVRPAHGGGDDHLLHSFGSGMYPTDWSADGGSILFHTLDPSTKHDIWSLDPVRGASQPLHRTLYDEAQGQLAPGGRLAYTSDESGVFQVYVRVLGSAAGPINVSASGGFDPRWRADGRELFFVSPKGALMAADVPTEGALRATPARALFATAIQETSPPYLSDFVVSKDGERFLIKVPTESGGAGPITVSLNWPRRLDRSLR
jgi:Tol biopolymer transport system component